MRQRGKSYRPERIAELIKREVSVIIDTEVSDPRVHGVSVTEVVTSRDLRHATVYVSVENDDGAVVDALNGCAGFIRHVLAENESEMRGVPQLRFEIDKSQSYYRKIDEVIRGLHEDDK